MGEPLQPIVIVPGFLDAPRFYRRLRMRLEEAGHDVLGFKLRSRIGVAGFAEIGADLARFIDERIGPGRDVGIVAFSMGGIAARYYVQRLGGAARVRPLVTVSTPHRGTYLAWLLPLKGMRQLRPNGAFLEDLNQDADLLADSGFVSIWSPLDAVIVPASSSRMGIGFERTFLVPLHAWMPQSTRVIDEVVRSVGKDRRNAPSGGDAVVRKRK